MIALDFAQAKTTHLIWLTKLQSYLDGKDGLTEDQIISPHSCDLGKWLDTEGKMKYSGLVEMQELEKAHDDLHATGAMIIKFNDAKDEAMVQKYFLDLIAISQKVLSSLDILERKISQPQ
ncbi:MAG: CZB domain-containing protein [Microgenomates group bacterium]|jgi:hypothetical protein